MLGRRQWEPVGIYLAMQAAGAFSISLVFTVNLIYHAQTVGLNPLQLVLVGTTLEVAVLLCETPTGILADLFSRRLSIILGMVLIGLAFVLEGSVPRFTAVLAAQVIWGLGYTFTSGATQAWLADEVGELAASRAFLRAAQLGQAASLAAIPVSVALAWALGLAAPIVVGGLGHLALALFLGLTMAEHGFQGRSPRLDEIGGHMWDTARTGLSLIRGRPALLVLVGLALVAGLYSEGYDRLWTPHLLQHFAFPAWWGLAPVAWFGVIRAGSLLLGMAANQVARRLRAGDEPARIVAGLRLLYGTLWIGLVILAWSHSFWWAVAGLWLIALSRSTIEPLEEAWIVQNTAGPVRATVISLWGQANAVGQILGGPAVGWIGTVAGLRMALSVSALLLLPAQGLLLAARSLPPDMPADLPH